MLSSPRPFIGRRQHGASGPHHERAVNWYYLSSPPQILRVPAVHLEPGGLVLPALTFTIVLTVTSDQKRPAIITTARPYRLPLGGGRQISPFKTPVTTANTGYFTGIILQERAISKTKTGRRKTYAETLGYSHKPRKCSGEVPQVSRWLVLGVIYSVWWRLAHLFTGPPPPAGYSLIHGSEGTRSMCHGLITSPSCSCLSRVPVLHQEPCLLYGTARRIMQYQQAGL
jgi:hypothetical protein